jgi:S1-C subfamily serine protease
MSKRFVTNIISLILLVAGVAAAQTAPPEGSVKGVPPGLIATPIKPTPAQSAPPRKDIPAIAKAANGSIVSIVMSDKDGKPIAQGSGFLVSKDGVIVTNYHVISEGSSAIVKLPDGAFYVVDGVLASDKVRDVAVIKAHGGNFRALNLGNSDQVQVGEEVVAIGNPLSLESTVSNGIVSGIRVVKEEGGKFLQVTAPISHGSSGGPLFNMVGEVVGITTLLIKDGENLNFAIPINDAKRLLLAKSSKIHALPNETESVRKQAHEENVPSSVSEEASLKDTLQWMQDSLMAGKGEVHADGQMSTQLTEFNACDVHFTYEESDGLRREYLFNLRDIDPSSIRFAMYTGDKSNYGYFDADVTNDDNKVAVRIRMTKDTGMDENRTYGFVTFLYPDYAARFVQAFRHAVNLCGGKSSVSRAYYRQLYDAGAFVEPSSAFADGSKMPRVRNTDYVCFGDDTTTETFFTFRAWAYDERYSESKDEMRRSTSHEEILKQSNAQQAIQQVAPYVLFMEKEFLNAYTSTAQQFFWGGGRILIEDVYSKGVKINTLQYHWDGSSWFLPIPPTDLNAYTRISKILRLSIEPTTMRYIESTTVTTTVGKGETAATGSDRYGPWAGVCKEVPNP